MSRKNEDGRIFQKVDPWMQDDEDMAAAGPLADCLYTRGLCYIRRNGNDGRIPKRSFGEVSYGFPSPQKILKGLVSVGLWRDEGTHWSVRNWDAKKESGKQWNMTEDERKARSDQKKEAGSLGGHRSKHTAEHPGQKCPHCVKQGWTQ